MLGLFIRQVTDALVDLATRFDDLYYLLEEGLWRDCSAELDVDEAFEVCDELYEGSRAGFLRGNVDDVRGVGFEEVENFLGLVYYLSCQDQLRAFVLYF